MGVLTLKKDTRVVFEDKRLNDISYCIDNGFRKLVPCSNFLGHPPFNEYGVMMPEEEETQPYLLVVLLIFKDYTNLLINDGDDTDYRRSLDFTLENWEKQLDLYNSITHIDKTLLDYLMEYEGFG